MRSRGALYLFASCTAVLALFAADIAQHGTTAGAKALLATPEVTVASSTENIKPVSYTAVPEGMYPVAHVVDGDTLDIDVRGQRVRLRLIGMDTPEVVDPRKPVQCFGREASDKAHELLDGQIVRIETDTSQGTFDKYGRTLVYVRLPSGVFYNEYMVAEGYAHEYTYKVPYKYQAALKADERAAREAEAGLWSPSTCDGDTKQAAK